MFFSTSSNTFLIAVVFSAVVEYLVHYYLEKAFHAYWWDYSKSPLNINGRICLPASLGFGLAGLVIMYLINPYLLPVIEKIPQLLRDIISLIMVFIFTADLVRELTVDVENIDFIHLSSYAGTESTGNFVFKKDISIDISGKNVQIQSETSGHL